MHRDRRGTRARRDGITTEDTDARDGRDNHRRAARDYLTMDDRTAESHTDRIDRYLNESGLSARHPRVLPLTGDASDRRYFRVLLDDGSSVVLALHAGPIEFQTLPFANVADLLQQMRLPVPSILGHSDAAGILALQDLGDVTLQAHLGAASAAEHAALYREAVSLIEILQRQGLELESDRFTPYRIAFDVEKLTWELEFFVKHFLLAYRGSSTLGQPAPGAGCRVVGHCRGTGFRTARALPPRLPQPKSDVARRSFVSD